MAIVLVTPEQQQDLWLLAEGRQKGKPTRRRGWGGNTPVQNHYVGLLGEYAASRVLDGYDYDKQFYGSSGDGGMPDLVGPAGGISVKTRTKRGYFFALSSDKPEDFKADAAVLCWPGDDATQKLFCTDPKPLDVSIAVEVVGIVSYNRFMEKAYLVDLGWGMRLALGHEHFTPILRPMWGWEVAAYMRG